MKTFEKAAPLLLILLLFSLSISAQTPQWDWARGIGSNGQDDVRSSMHLDSAGNIYEIIDIGGRNITLAGHLFTNPSPEVAGGGGSAIPIFVKYNSQGQVVWANQHFPKSNGSFIAPNLLYTDRRGYTYAYYGFLQDSMTIQGLTVRNNTSPSAFCIAKYDPNGDVMWIHVKHSNQLYQPYTSIIAMLPRDDGHILLLAQVQNGGANPTATDTIDGIPLPQGSFLAIMDTAARFERIKYLGADTITWPLSAGGYALYHEAIANLYTYGAFICTNTHKSVYLQIYPSPKTVWDTSIHIIDAFSYITTGHSLFLKFDSLLNFSWSLGGNAGVGPPFTSDNNDNLYVSGYGTTQIGDTLRIGNIVQTFPINLRSPNAYFAMIKIDSGGNTLWIDTFLNRTGGSGNIQALLTDKIGNVYMGGRYDSYLNAGPYTLPDPNNLFVIKADENGTVKWMQGTKNYAEVGAQSNFAADDKGDIYISGIYFYTGQPGFGPGDPIFGRDSLIGITPIAGFPVAPDIFNARLGNCNPIKPIITASAPLTWCGIDSVRLIATTANSYLWSNGDTSRSIVVRNSGSYNVYGIDTLGCYARSDNANIKANPDPQLNASTIRNVSCYGGNDGEIALHITNGTRPYLYSSLITDTNHVAAGTYIITVTDSAACTAKDTVTITQPSFALSIQADSAGQTAHVFAIGATPPYTYLWSNSMTNDTITQLPTGEYSVTVTDANGCRAIDSVYVVAPTGINDIAGVRIYIFPTPATSIVYIESSAAGFIAFYNLIGQMVLRAPIKVGKNVVDVGSFNDGVYITEVRSQEQLVYKRKITVSHL